MGWEGLLKNEVRMKHMIAVDYIELVFVDIKYTCNLQLLWC